MLFHNKQRKINDSDIPKLKMNELFIEQVDNFNFLGIIFDKSLTWKDHIDKISSKISKSIGILNRIKSFTPKYILKNIYNTLITPHLYYGILVWGYNNTRLYNLQKKGYSNHNRLTFFGIHGQIIQERKNSENQ